MSAGIYLTLATSMLARYNIECGGHETYGRFSRLADRLMKHQHLLPRLPHTLGCTARIRLHSLLHATLLISNLSNAISSWLYK